jgi:mannose-6-phosphate isomerase
MISRLPRTLHNTVWGSDRTSPWFETPRGTKLGEIWFEASDQVPLLVKLLFTSEKLSVQVHPQDAYARTHHNCSGKTEMWHILRADPGARIALGLNRSITPEQLREAAVSGAIVDLLNWISARPGDTFFVPAGTIHAISEGLVLCEVQQVSNVTYRLFDYQRGRELHLDHSVAVAHCGAHESAQVGLPLECGYFKTGRLEAKGSVEIGPIERGAIYVALQGEGTIAGEAFRAGEAFEMAAGARFRIESPDAAFLFTEAR